MKSCAIIRPPISASNPSQSDENTLDDITTSLSEFLSSTKNHEGDLFVVVECPGASEPKKLRERFQDGDQDATVDNFISIIDAKLFFSTFGSDVRLGTTSAATSSLCLDDSIKAVSSGVRSVTELMLDQVECSDVVLMSNFDSLSSADIDLVENVIFKINPSAKVLKLKDNFSDVCLKDILRYKNGEGVATCSIEDEHRILIEAIERENISEKSTRNKGTQTTDVAIRKNILDTAEDAHQSVPQLSGLSSFVYKRRKPFHPIRISQFLQRIGQLSVKSVGDVSASVEGSETQLSSFDHESSKKTLVRSKGIAWVASSKAIVYLWSHAGQFVELNILGRWWGDVNEKDWPETASDHVKVNFAGTEGDRRQELVFVGKFSEAGEYSKEAIESLLDTCLVTEHEFDMYKMSSKGGDEALRRAFYS